MADAKKTIKTSGSKRTATTATTAAVNAAPVKKAPPAKPATTSKAKATVAAKPVRSKTTKKPAAIPLEQRRNYVEVAAYYIAAARGFAPGDPLQDWIQAETEIDRLLKEGRLGVLLP